MTQEKTQESVLLNLSFSKDADGVTTISKIDYVPLYIWDNGETAQDRYEVVSIPDALSTETDPDRIAVLEAAAADLKASTQSDYAQP